MDTTKKYEIIYEMGDDLEKYFMEKGFRNDISVLIGDKLYELYFFLPSTIEYEMTTDGYCAIPGLILLNDITTRNIEIAVEKLVASEYFDYLIPFKKGEKRYWDKIYYSPTS